MAAAKLPLSLAMDFASRMKRAGEQGWEHGWFHSTKNDFPAFSADGGKSRRGSDFGFHVGGAEAADNAIAPAFVKRMAEQGDEGAIRDLARYYEDAQIMPLSVNRKKTVRLPDLGRWDFGGNAHSNLADTTSFYTGPARIKPDLDTDDPVFAQRLLDLSREDVDWKEGFTALMDEFGYDSIVYRNTVEGGGDSLMLLRPEQLRATTGAKFDPANAGKNDLLGAVAGAAPLGLAGALGVGAAVAPGEAEAGVFKGIKTAATRGADEIADALDYGIRHRPASRGTGASLDDLTNIYPDDVYSADGARFYGSGGGGAEGRMDQKAVDIMRRARGNPDFTVTVYRAVPTDVDDVVNSGDWVALTPEYARRHGDSWVDGDYKILATKVRAGDLFTEGNSLQEFGWNGFALPSRLAATAAAGGAGVGAMQMDPIQAYLQATRESDNAAGDLLQGADDKMSEAIKYLFGPKQFYHAGAGRSDKSGAGADVINAVRPGTAGMAEAVRPDANYWDKVMGLLGLTL